MSVELAFINQLLTKPNSAEKVTLTAGAAITKGSEITINNDGEAELNAYNIIPDNTISSYFFDYGYNIYTSANSTAAFGTYNTVRNFGPNKEFFAFLQSESDSSSSGNPKIYLYVLKMDTSTNTISTVGNILVKQHPGSQGDGPTYTTFMITPEEDYIFVAFGGRYFVTGNTNYGNEVYRITLSSTGGLSSSTRIYDAAGSSGNDRILYFGDNAYYSVGTAITDRYIYLRTYYSTQFNSVIRLRLDGSSQYITSDYTSSVGGAWYNVDKLARSYSKQLHYCPTTNTFGYIRDLNYFTNSSYWGQFSITPDTGAVQFREDYCIYIDDDPDANNIVRYVMWDGNKYVTTYQIEVDPTGTNAPTLSGQYTTTITDANVFLCGISGNIAKTGNKWAKSGNDVYFAPINTKFTSDSTDSGPDYQANILKLTYTSTNGGYYTLTHQGLVDTRIPATGANYTPFMRITTDGTFVGTISSDWDTTDGINDYKHGLFKVSTTGLSDATYAHKVKCVALEDATAGNTFQALSYAPVVSDSTLVAGTVYDRHIATSNGLLIEKA
jgi:hypothetical protein